MENKEVKQKTLYQKLLAIQVKINGLGKDKAATNYRYVTGDKVLGEIKPIMNDLGLILKQEIISIENVRQDYKVGKDNRDKSEMLSKVMMRFTWIDTESGEKDENLFGANGQNDWDKGVGSALTYAERYFLLKFFHIATDEDDIDNPDRGKDNEKKEPKPEEKPKEPEVKQMTEGQKTYIIKLAANKKAFTDEQSKEMLKWLTNPITFEQAQRSIARWEAVIKLKENQPVTA